MDHREDGTSSPGPGGPDPPASPDRTTDQVDRALLERLRANDRDALAAVYDRHGRQAFGLACRVVEDEKEAEDVVQEAFLALWRQSGRLEASRGSVRSLLLTIVHRRAIDVIRRRAGRPEVGIERAATLAADLPDPSEAASKMEERAVVARAMGELPVEQRQAIELTYFAGLTIAEMAQQTGIPLGTAKSRLRLALERMRSSIGEPRPT